MPDLCDMERRCAGRSQPGRQDAAAPPRASGNCSRGGTTTSRTTLHGSGSTTRSMNSAASTPRSRSGGGCGATPEAQVRVGRRARGRSRRKVGSRRRPPRMGPSRQAVCALGLGERSRALAVGAEVLRVKQQRGTRRAVRAAGPSRYGVTRSLRRSRRPRPCRPGADGVCGHARQSTP